MICQTLKIKQERAVLKIQLNRPEAGNSLNSVLVEEMLQVVKEIENDASVKVIVIEGLPDVFCTGMDFQEFVQLSDTRNHVGSEPNQYFNLLKCFTQTSKIVISRIEGKVNAGGVGLVAASDIVIADEQATFSLSEALFGLLPACVLPFLIRRIGFQRAYWLALTTQSITAKRAHEIGLVDEWSEQTNDILRRYLLRLLRLDPQTIQRLKAYMTNLWLIDEKIQKIAVERIESLMNDPKIQNNLENYVKEGIFPWQK